MSEQFQREERYVVVKISKMHPHPNFREKHLRALKSEHEDALVDCVVVERDWPEFPHTWAAIERRVTGRPPEWDGTGHPPPGAHVDYFHFVRGDYVPAIAIGQDIVDGAEVTVIRTNSPNGDIGYDMATQLRPGQAPADASGNARQEAINELACEIAGYMGFDGPRAVDSRLAEYLHDQDFRKREVSWPTRSK